MAVVKPAAPSPKPAGLPTGVNRVPVGGQLISTNWPGIGEVFLIVYDIGGGQKVYYDVSNPTVRDGSNLAAIGPATRMEIGQFTAIPGLAHGGQASELWTIKEGSYQEWFNKQLTIISGGNEALATDPEVRGILADFIANPRPDPKPELEAKLKQTQYWKTRTDNQAVWNDLSPATQASRVQEEAIRLGDLWLRNVGSPLSFTDPRMQEWATGVASGKYGEGFVTESFIKPEAAKNSESPWMRTLRSENEAQNKRPVDVENKEEEVRDLYRRWGLQPSGDAVHKWASDITTNASSDADLLQSLQQMSSVLYPWKPPAMETLTAAQPWLDTFNRVLEKPTDLFDPKVQQALTSGTPIYQFEQQLRESDDWLHTKNASDQLSSATSDIGRLMGFV